MFLTHALYVLEMSVNISQLRLRLGSQIRVEPVVITT
jgi:hypothetical protein